MPVIQSKFARTVSELKLIVILRPTQTFLVEQSQTCFDRVRPNFVCATDLQIVGNALTLLMPAIIDYVTFFYTGQPL